jgi:hypothetical protein
MGSGKYQGKWVEPVSNKIELEFTPDNAKKVIAHGLDPESSYSHQDIAHWCEKFWNKYCDIDAPEEIEKVMPVLADIETQWDLYLANTYSLKELKMKNFNEVRLPAEWFQKWLVEINA